MKSKQRANAVISYFFAKIGLQKIETEDPCKEVKLAVGRLKYSINERLSIFQFSSIILTDGL